MRKNNKTFYRKIQLPFKVKKPVLALGGQTKNTVCFTQGTCAQISPVHSDLVSPEAFLRFEQDARYFFRKKPKVIAFDLHPEYQSSKYAQEFLRSRRIASVSVQHHHAHIAACMAENGLKNQKVIGVAFDGTGLGNDGTLWGAEFLVCDYTQFTRSAHLREIPLLGGERAIVEPWRLAAAWLHHAYQERFLGLKVNFTKGIDKRKWRMLNAMQAKNVFAPRASSMGRLFDAAGSLILEKNTAGFEGELAIALEIVASRLQSDAAPFDFTIIKTAGGLIIDPAPMFKEIIADLKHQQPQEKIAYRFHATVAAMVKKTCIIIRQKTKIRTVTLSGGVFQNKLLLTQCVDLLSKEGFKVITHTILSCNDSCISLGQAVIAGVRS